MLVLTRKPQEKIRIGDHVTITVLRMKGKAVRLGIEAPSEVPVIRGELCFDRSGKAPAESNDEDPAEDTAVTTARRSLPRNGRTSPEWTTASRPCISVAPTRDEAPAHQVGFARVSRDKAAKIVPQMVAGPHPLRAMLDQRPKAL